MSIEDLPYSRADVNGDAVDEHDGAIQPDVGNEDAECIPPRRSALRIIDDRLANKDGRKYVTICAPMVRYSKLPFREIVRKYETDVCYTPMILAGVYKHSHVSRSFEFRTNRNDDPVIVQFAASSPSDLADASLLASPYASGVDLNCGCPQKWAIQEKLGSFMMEHPEMVQEMVRQTKERTAGVRMADGDHFPVSIKIRIHNDLKKTVEFARRAEKVGVDWITVHGRTRRQRNTEPVDYEAIKLVKENINVPVFANGDIYTRQDADSVVERTGVDGVMSARGLLENPALFAGHQFTPLSAVEDYVRLAIGYGTNHFIFHHHLMYMLGKSMNNSEKKMFNCLTSIPAVLDYLEDHYGLAFGNATFPRPYRSVLT
ncbi:hypothetical protein BC832DRAFT_575831 [Gaertneriomyces semiglobifer]|nr:hypothetical protein BC832DRAFT_575831 [Gaertneriomyces semiglobifer]